MLSLDHDFQMTRSPRVFIRFWKVWVFFVSTARDLFIFDVYRSMARQWTVDGMLASLHKISKIIILKLTWKSFWTLGEHPETSGKAVFKLFSLSVTRMKKLQDKFPWNFSILKIFDISWKIDDFLMISGPPYSFYRHSIDVASTRHWPKHWRGDRSRGVDAKNTKNYCLTPKTNEMVAIQSRHPQTLHFW